MANTALLNLLNKYQPKEMSKTGQTLAEYGYPISEKPKKTTLSKVLDFLRTGEYAMGGLMAGKGIKTGVKQKISPSTVLGVKSKVGKLAIDILFDPITYITFGYGGAMKLTSKTGAQIVLSKTGTKTLKAMAKKLGEKTARKSMAELIAKGGVKAEAKYLAKGGMKFAGVEVVPRALFTKGGKGLDALIGKIPIAGKGYRVGKETLEIAFKPFTEIEKLPAKYGGKGAYVKGAYMPYAKGTRAAITKGVEPVIQAGKVAAKAVKPKWYQTSFKKPKAGEMLAETIEKGVSESKVIDDIARWMKGEHKAMLEAEKTRGIVKTELPNYLRHFLTEKGREFLDAGGNLYSGLSKPLRVKLGAAKPRKLEGTIKEINQAMKGKVKGDFFEPDAFKAFAARKVEHIKAVNTYDFLKDVAAKYGRPAEYITKRTIKGQEKVLKKTIIDGVEFAESTAPQLKGLILPKPIAKHLDETAQFLKGDEATNIFLRMYDKLLAFWKGTVTGYFPAFHTRNFTGGVFNNWLAGLKSPLRYFQAEDILKGKKKVYTTKLGTKYTSKEITELASKHGVTGQTGMMDVMRQVEKEVGQSKLRKLGDYPRFLMETVENRLRMPLFLDRLLKGDTAQEAAEWVFKFHFDYTPEGLTAFERNWMRRLIPFYRWTRGNIPLQIEQMIKQPAKYASLEKVRQSITGKTGKEEFEYLPDWMREQFTMRIGEKGGKSLWLQLDLPMEDIAKLPITKSGMREFVSMLSPFLKYPIERYTNKTLFFGGDIVNPDLPKEMQTTKVIEQLRHLPEPIKKFLNFKKVQYRDYQAEKKLGTGAKVFKERYEMDAQKLHLLRTAVGRFYMTFGQAFDPEFTLGMKISRLIGGIPIRPIDIEEEKEWRQWEIERKERETLQYLKKHKEIPYAGEKKNTALEELLKKAKK